MAVESEWIDILLTTQNGKFHQLLERHLQAEGVPLRIHRVEDPGSLVQILKQPEQVPLEDFGPRLVVVDTSKNEEGGFQFLSDRQTLPEIRKIPVVVLTPEEDEEWILHIYRMGVTSVVSKPESYDQLATVVETLIHYWFGIVKLPTPL